MQKGRCTCSTAEVMPKNSNGLEVWQVHLPLHKHSSLVLWIVIDNETSLGTRLHPDTGYLSQNSVWRCVGQWDRTKSLATRWLFHTWNVWCSVADCTCLVLSRPLDGHHLVARKILTHPGVAPIRHSPH